MSKEKIVKAVATLARSPAYDFYEPMLHKVATKILADDSMFIPKYQSSEAACADLIANIPEGELTFQRNSTFLVDCGFNLELQAGYRALISARSGLASKGLIVANGPGIVDSDYRGRVKVILANIGENPITIKHGDRVAQMSIEPVYVFDWVPVSRLTDTTRGNGGFGSTGK